MSVESAKKFIERIKADEEFRKAAIRCKDAASRQAFVRNAGFDFTLEELNETRAEIADEELDRIAGGNVMEYQNWCSQAESFWYVVVDHVI